MFVFFEVFFLPLSLNLIFSLRSHRHDTISVSKPPDLKRSLSHNLIHNCWMGGGLVFGWVVGATLFLYDSCD